MICEVCTNERLLTFHTSTGGMQRGYKLYRSICAKCLHELYPDEFTGSLRRAVPVSTIVMVP